MVVKKSLRTVLSLNSPCSEAFSRLWQIAFMDPRFAYSSSFSFRFLWRILSRKFLEVSKNSFDSKLSSFALCCVTFSTISSLVRYSFLTQLRFRSPVSAVLLILKRRRFRNDGKFGMFAQLEHIPSALINLQETRLHCELRKVPLISDDKPLESSFLTKA